MCSLEKRKLRNALLAHYSYTEAVSWQRAVIEQEEMASRCTMGGVDRVLGKISSPEGLSKHWSRLPRLLVESPSLQIFKRHMVCSDMVS